MANLSRAAAVALLAALLPACTAFDRFKLADPAGEVTLEGEVESAPYAPNPPTPRKYRREFNDCPVGATVYWGHAKNTGDVTVEDVKVVIDVFGPGGDLLGRFTDGVFNGEVAEDAGANPTPNTSLDVEQTGVFAVCCASVRWGAAARASLRFEFLVPDAEEG